MKRFIASLVSCVLLSSMVVYAGATDVGFTDVNPGDSRAEAISYMAQQGYMCGTSGTTFDPDSPVTQGILALVLARVVCPEEVDKAFSNAACDFETSLDNFTRKLWAAGMYDSMCMPSENVTMRGACSMIFDMLGIPTFGNNQASSDAVLDLAITSGLLSSEEEGSDLATRGDVAEIIYKIQTDKVELPVPAVMEDYNITREEEFLNIAPYLYELSFVPQEVLDSFKEDGWSIVIGDDKIAEWSQENGMLASGLCSYSEKVIYVRQPSSVVHEFGHYQMELLGEPESFYKYYNESVAASKILGNYCLTNYREYYAEVFEYWNKYHGDQEALNALKAAAPRTYQFMESVSALW